MVGTGARCPGCKSYEPKACGITSVNRDERQDGGAPIFAMVIRRIRQLLPGCSVEVLIPDFKANLEALAMVMHARPRYPITISKRFRVYSN